VHVVLKVRGVTQQRSADARGVTLAALDDAHRVVLAVAPAARQPRAHLQRYLAAAHLRVVTQAQAKGAHSARAQRSEQTTLLRVRIGVSVQQRRTPRSTARVAHAP
jgi:hypothetical protein